MGEREEDWVRERKRKKRERGGGRKWRVGEEGSWERERERDKKEGSGEIEEGRSRVLKKTSKR